MNYERKSFGNFRAKTIFRILISILLSLGALFYAPGKVFAASGSWWTTNQGAVRLIASSNAVGNLSQLHLGLHFQMKPGWKIYWRSPGDAGFPPEADWSGSENLGNMKIDWPAPTRFSVTGLETLGYKEEVVFPLTLRLLEAGKGVKIRSKVRYLTCDEICIPYEATLALSLPPGPEGSSPEAYLINEFRSQVPKKVKGLNSSISSVVVDGSAGKQVLRITAQALAKPDLIIEGPPGFRFGKVEVMEGKIKGKIVLTTKVFSSTSSSRTGNPIDLVGKKITLTLLGGSTRGIEYKVKPKSTILTTSHSTTSLRKLIGIVALALFGGLILNLMPCVLPVLSLKLLSVIGYSGESLRVVRGAFLASTIGILVSFLILGSTAVILKSFGQTVGWGIQFQQPAFLTAMSVVVVLFAANVWGLFEIRLPSFLADRAASAGRRQTMAGHFATGAFAALLATPCSAPFLGTAVGFALAHGAFEIYLIFTALGLGLALPYILVALFPALANLVPKPGKWMITLRRILALALTATAIWLVTVLDTQIGRLAALINTGSLLLLATLIIFYYRIPKLFQNAVLISLVMITLVAIFVPLKFAEVNTNVKSIVSQQWQKFNPAVISGYVANGKTVFVDVTADWCITCKVNRALVLDTDEIRVWLKQKNIVQMRADWTSPNPIIAAFLQGFMRYGIPFNVAFGPKAVDGIILPELLSKKSVIEALELAQTGQVTTEK